MRRKAVAALTACLAASCVSIPPLMHGAADGGDAGVVGSDAMADGTDATSGEGAADGADASDQAETPGDAESGSSDGSPACPGPYASAVMGVSGLVAYWRLDETAGSTAHDTTGAHAGTYGGAVGLGSPGLLVGDPDLAATFDGDAGASVDVASDPAFDLQTFTLGAIIRPSAIVLADMGQQIVARPDAYWIQLDAPSNGADQASLEVGIITPQLTDNPWPFRSAALTVGTPAHVVGTYDGSTIAGYVNGKLAGSAPLQVTVGSPANPLHIGSWDGASHFQAGVVDEVFVVRRALNASEIQALYEAAQGCAYGDGG
ncbi:MAG TPA: LamG domain-containing protein [Polyangiaceae bacterium]|nr:LamG domain-containing protein [Polyangiaceae bacterium]